MRAASPVVEGAGAPWIVAGPGGRAALHDGWRVAPDPRDRGRRRGWARGGFAGRAVAVPHVPGARSVTGPGGRRAHRGSVAWYRRALRASESGQHVLRFESVNHRASVYLDGRRVARHVGTYLPFEVAVDLREGRAHRLVVRADWRDPDAMKAEGWHRTWFNFGGINREVTVRRATPSTLDAPQVRTRLRGRGAEVDVAIRVGNRTGRARPVAVEGLLRRGSQAIPVRFATPTVGAGGTRVLRATVTVPEPALWAPGSPALYDLAFVAGAPATDGDRVAGVAESSWHQRVGLRELTWPGGRLTLNGRPLELKGASLHEDAADRGDALRPADQQRLVDHLRYLGATATRAQHPLDPGLLERLDAAGIVLWLGVGPVDSPGSWTSKTPRMRAAARERVRTSVAQARAHPSVIAWNLVNELAGNGHDAGQVGYLRAMTRELHRTDPGRMVAIDLWGAHPPRRPGPVWEGVDAVGVTNYTGWYSENGAGQAVVAQTIRDQLAALRRAFPAKVLAVSEFGAEGNGLNAASAPGGLAYQAALVRTHLEVYRSTPGLAGALVWALRDFAVSPAFAGGSIRRVVPGIELVRGVNQKGLFTRGGAPKPAARAVRSALR